VSLYFARSLIIIHGYYIKPGQKITPGDVCMSEEDYRILPAVKGRVQCLDEKKEPVENCGFCIHCREFGIGKTFIKSPSLAYCTKCRVTERVDMAKVTSVKCADRQGGGFHSITNIIS
jgi:hypothetical protein